MAPERKAPEPFGVQPVLTPNGIKEFAWVYTFDLKRELVMVKGATCYFVVVAKIPVFKHTDFWQAHPVGRALNAAVLHYSLERLPSGLVIPVFDERSEMVLRRTIGAQAANLDEYLAKLGAAPKPPAPEVQQFQAEMKKALDEAKPIQEAPKAKKDKPANKPNKAKESKAPLPAKAPTQEDLEAEIAAMLVDIGI